MEEVHELWQEQRVIDCVFMWSLEQLCIVAVAQFTMYVYNFERWMLRFRIWWFRDWPRNRQQDVSELQCDHEEADTSLLLHSKHAAEAHDRIIVKTPDTDVLVLCRLWWLVQETNFASWTPQLYQKHLVKRFAYVCQDFMLSQIQYIVLKQVVWYSPINVEYKIKHH
jgi:hypothetical protein